MTWRPSDRMGLATIFAGVLGTLVVLPFTQDPSYLISAIPLVVLIGLAGILLRRLRLGDGLVFLAQLVLLAVYLFAIAIPLTPPEGSVPGLFVEGVQHMATHTAPMVPNPGLTVLLVAATGISALLTDLLAEGVQRPSWALLPPMMLFLVGAIGLVRDIPWWTVLLVGLGYLAILWADGLSSTERWSRGLDRNLRLTGRLGGLAARMGAVIGAIVFALALLVGLLVPLPPTQHWNQGNSDEDSGPVQLADPMLDMRRNLSLPADEQVLTYTTTAPQGTYLRMATLPVLDAQGWQNSAFHLTKGQNLPQPPGVTNPGEEFTTEIQVADYRSEYLPLPYAPSSFSAEGEWAYGSDNLVVIATGEDRTSATRDLQYSATSVDVSPDGAVLSTAAAGQPGDGNLTADVPQDMPQEIVDLTLEITQAEPTPALKAAAIQEYLRGDEFTYSLEPQPGTGYEAMERFLLEDRTGYCEQFAGSMAAMARVAGIPSRVAVGWLPGDPTANGYEVTTHDMHAWPELYFEDLGWVRFEPTPGVAAPPAWTVTADEEEEESPSPTPSPEEEPVPAPVEPSTMAPPPPPTDGVEEEQGGVSVAAVLARLAVALGVLAAMVALAAIPGIVRRVQRRRRLAPVRATDAPDELAADYLSVDRAWDEVRASFLDYGHAWPNGSPRAVGRAGMDVLPDEAGTALLMLSHEVERSRYAREAMHHGDLGELVLKVREGLRHEKTWDERLAAEWWPASLFRREERSMRRRRRGVAATVG